MDIWVKMVSFQIIQNVLNVKTKDCSEIKDTKLNAHISLTFLAKSFINKMLFDLDKFKMCL